MTIQSTCGWTAEEIRTTSLPLLSMTYECKPGHVFMLRFECLNRPPRPCLGIGFKRRPTGHCFFNRDDGNPRRESRSPGPCHRIAFARLLRKVGVPAEDVSTTVPLPWKDTSSCPTWLGTRGWNGNVFLPIPGESGPIPSHRTSGRSRGMGYPNLSSPTILCMKRSFFSSDRKLVLFHPSSCPFRSVFACCVRSNTSPYTVIWGGTCPLDSHNPPRHVGPSRYLWDAHASLWGETNDRLYLFAPPINPW